MRTRIQTHLGVFTCGLTYLSVLALAAPLRADEIVALVDEHGHKVYVNTGVTSKHPTYWMTHNFREVRQGPSAVSFADIDRWVGQTADRFQVDPQLVHAIIQTESEYDPNAVSRKGAIGLMQLIPSTAQRFGVANPYDPKQNIEGGVNYLRYLLNLFGGDLNLSLAAYNAGEHSVLRSGGIPSFQETRRYVRKVTNLYGGGPMPPLARGSVKEPPRAEIIRYVDAQGVVHYTNVE